MPDVRIPSALPVDDLAARIASRLDAPADRQWAGTVVANSFSIRPVGWNFGAVRGRLYATAQGSEIALGPPRPPLASLVIAAVLGYFLLPRTDWRAHLPSMIGLAVVLVLLLLFQDRQYRAQWARTRRFLEEVAR